MGYKINDEFPSRFIGGDDLGETQPIVTISEVVKEQVEQPGRGGRTETSDVLVVYFAGSKSGRGMRLNTTRARTIAKLYGNDTDGWIGKKLQLRAIWIKAFGDTHHVVEVLPSVPTGKAAKQAPAAETAAAPADPDDIFPEDEIPAYPVVAPAVLDAGLQDR